MQTYGEFLKYGAQKEVNRWGQVPIMDSDGNFYVDFDPSAYADARVADIEGKRTARGAELEPEKREEYYQKYLDEGLKYADWEPPYNSPNQFLEMTPQNAMQAYTEYLNSWQPRFKSGTDEEGNYWSKMEPDVPSEIIDAKFGGSSALNDMVLGAEGSPEYMALMRHLLSGMPAETSEDFNALRSFIHGNKIFDEKFPSKPYPGWDATDEERDAADAEWKEMVKDYLQRNVYDHIPHPEVKIPKVQTNTKPGLFVAQYNSGQNIDEMTRAAQNPVMNGRRNVAGPYSTFTPGTGKQTQPFGRDMNAWGQIRRMNTSSTPTVNQNAPIQTTQGIQKMQSYEDFKKQASYGYQPNYTHYESSPTGIIAGNVPGFQNAPPRNIGGRGYAQGGNVQGQQGQQGWDVTRNAQGQVTSFSNQAGLQRQQRMQQIAQTRQGGNITPQQYQQMVAQRQYQMQQAAYQWHLRRMQQQQMASQQRMMSQQNYGQRPQMATPPPPQPQVQQMRHGSVTSTVGTDAQGRRTFSAHN